MSIVNPMSVVLVDDNPDDLALVGRFLEEAGHVVRRASDGADALRLLRERDSQVLITDWHMKPMDGLELCRSLRRDENLPFIYIIVLTVSEATHDHIVQAFEAGADDYCVKPVTRRALLARLTAADRIIRLTSAVDARTLDAHQANAQLAIANERLAQVNERLRLAAATDELTGLLNRREAMARLEEHWSESLRRKTPLSCMSIDLDRFKNYNDVHGHAVGDVVLKSIASELQRVARRHERVYRVGGEEFLILCPGALEAEAAAGGERLRRAIDGLIIQANELRMNATISIGVAQRDDTMRRPDDLLRHADAALYAAKNAGRNTVIRSSEIAHDRVIPAPRVKPESASGGSRPVVAVVGPIAAAEGHARALSAEFRALPFDLNDSPVAAVLGEAPNAVLLDVAGSPTAAVEGVSRWRGALAAQQIPLIVAVDRNDVRTLRECVSAGAQECVLSPFEPEEAVLRIRTIVGLQEQVARSNEVRGEQSRALALLSDFSQDVAGAAMLDSVIELTARTSAALTCCHQAYLLMPRADSRKFEIRHALATDLRSAALAVVQRDGTLCGEAFKTRSPILIKSGDDLAALAHHADINLVADGPAMIAPIIGPCSVVGVLVLAQRQEPRPFSVSEQAYVELICNIGGAAIEEHLTRQARDDARHSIVIALARLAEYRDSDTGRHVDRVTRFCGLLARRLRSDARFGHQIDEQFLSDLEHAAPLHDIGKVAVPDHVLLKPTRLTEDEFKVMTSHTTIGARTIRSVMDRAQGVSFLVMAEQIAQSHHEWHDGSGYPAGISGGEIPLPAKILAVADVYDAITSRRVYKEAMPHSSAVALIKAASGKQFDPAVVAAFLAVHQEFQSLAAQMGDSHHNRLRSAHEGTDALRALEGAAP